MILMQLTGRGCGGGRHDGSIGELGGESRCGVSILQEVVGHLRGTSRFACTREAKDEEIEHQSVVLEDEGRELQAPNETICVHMSNI